MCITSLHVYNLNQIQIVNNYILWTLPPHFFKSFCSYFNDGNIYLHRVLYHSKTRFIDHFPATDTCIKSNSGIPFLPSTVSSSC